MRLLALIWSLLVAVTLHAQPPAKPNILLILADDLGYSDLGCYGSEIRTPHLDQLAKHGLRFTQFYNTARCWPTRAAILTGYYAQQVRRDTVPGLAQKSGAQGTRPGWARLLPELLQPLGYRTYHSGKWHVDGKPLAGGFQRSYSLNDHDRHFYPRQHTENDQPLPAIGKEAGYYSSTAIAEHAIGQLKEHASQHLDKPFFTFLAFTAPHFPLQAPPEDVNRYATAYSTGWDALRTQRFARQASLGLHCDHLPEIERDLGPPYVNPDAYKKLGPQEVNRPILWSSLSRDQQDFQARKMAVHAAMVDRMDREIGRVLEQLRNMKALENTLIFFLSDNGASAEIMVRGDGHDQHADCGTGATFLSLGPGWSSLANTPFRRHKTWVHEGGISTPLIVHWPQGLTARGELRHSPGHVIDIPMTILDVAGGQPMATWQDRPVPTPPGKSLMSVLKNDTRLVRPYLWWMHEKNRALRQGNWKIVASGQNAPWELYDLSRDRGETRNLAMTMPEMVAELAELWTRELELTKRLAE
jgi:arylsulfatase A-like enzyme